MHALTEAIAQILRKNAGKAMSPADIRAQLLVQGWDDSGTPKTPFTKQVLNSLRNLVARNAGYERILNGTFLYVYTRKAKS